MMRLRADFNGLFGDLLCLSHGDSCKSELGEDIRLTTGMIVTVFDEDVNEHGERDDLIASGTVEQSPEWLQCRGSKWVLRMDRNGVRHQSDANSSLKCAADRDLLELFSAQGRDFERSFLDDDWSRLERYFAVDAIYETLGPGGERFAGRSALLAALQRSVTNFDRRCDSRTLVTVSGPFLCGSEIDRTWRCTFTLAGAPDLAIEGRERAVYRSGLIELLQEELTPRSRESLNSWLAAYGSMLRPRGGTKQSDTD